MQFARSYPMLLIHLGALMYELFTFAILNRLIYYLLVKTSWSLIGKGLLQVPVVNFSQYSYLRI